MQMFIKKISSRKLWAAVVGVATGFAMVFELDTDIVTTVAGAVVSAASVVSYILAEGKIDAAAVKTAIEAAQKSKDAICDEPDR